MTLVLLCLPGSVIIWLPFFSDNFYVPMQTTFDFSMIPSFAICVLLYGILGTCHSYGVLVRDDKSDP
ncbi:hypothetical protein ACFL1C_06800 [Pseudomonadota bacterium]